MNLDELRKSIKQIDEKIISFLGERKILSEKVADFKAKNKLEVQDENYEVKLLASLIEKSGEKNLDPEFIRKIFSEILKNSRKIQNEKIKTNL